MRGFDFSPLYRSTVGFDQLQSLLDSVTQDTAPTYPPYNIERTSENDYRITVAVAGFGQDDLEIEVKQNVLTISGKRAEPEETTYLYRGIAGRSFERRFQLADHVEVGRRRGIGEIFGHVLRENRAMLDMCDDLGFTRHALEGDPTLIETRLKLS